MHDLIFTPQAYNEYLEWLNEDKKTYSVMGLQQEQVSLNR